MFRTLLYALYIGLFMLTTPITFIPYYIMKLFRLDAVRERYAGKIASFYARHVVWSAGGRVTVRGIENLPPQKNLCFISNHQGFMDIPVILGYIPVPMGFIAKKELAKIPILRMWMKGLGCIMLDRKNLRSSLEVILQGAASIAGGHPMVIFPEGTRSRSHTMQSFKAGSMKLATKSKGLIVPLTIDGAYKLFEETGRINPTSITLTIHPPVAVENFDKNEQKELPERVWNIINGSLAKQIQE